MPHIPKERHIGSLRLITSSSLVAQFDDDLFTMERTINGRNYPAGQVGSFIVMPVGDVEVIAIVTRTRFVTELNKELDAQLIGSITGGKFQKGIAVYPSIGADVFMTDEKGASAVFASFAQFGFAVGDISGYPGERQYVDPNKFFGKHIALLGSSGSGKSTTVASILQKVQMFTNTHIIVLDIHNEYSAAFPDYGNLINITELEMPYWFMNFEELCEMFVDDNESAAQSQIMMLKDLVLNAKKAKNPSLQSILTVDSPVFYDLNEVRAKFQFFDSERISISGGTREGPFFGQFTRFLVRLDSKMTDKRYEFMFKPRKFKDSNALKDVLNKILGLENKKSITVLDMSGVPFDIVNTIVALMARTIFDFNFWNKAKADFPIMMLFEEAHNYLPNIPTPQNRAARKIVERIAKEGRKYGVGCMIVSQRPSELSETILSQCNNFVILRLTNPTDQNFVKKLVPDSFAGMFDMLPSMRQGEAMFVGDAVPLPARVQLDFPQPPPNSADILFYDKWIAADRPTDVSDVVERWWHQDRS